MPRKGRTPPEEAGAGDGGARTGLQRRPRVAGLGDPAGEEQRVVGRERGARFRQQLQRRSRAANVTASLDSLDDDSVGAGPVRFARLRDRTALVQPDAGRPPLRPAPEGDGDVRLCRCLEPVAPRERQKHIDGERPPRQRPRRRQLVADRLGPADGDRPQAPGL